MTITPPPKLTDDDVDEYGNPIDGSRLINCCFPDCGCDGSRNCMAESGASYGSIALNRERTASPQPAPGEQE